MPVEKVDFTPGCAHVGVKFEVLEKSARSALFHADDDRLRKPLGGDRISTVQQVDRGLTECGRVGFRGRWGRPLRRGVLVESRRAKQEPKISRRQR